MFKWLSSRVVSLFSKKPDEKQETNYEEVFDRERLNHEVSFILSEEYHDRVARVIRRCGFKDFKAFLNEAVHLYCVAVEKTQEGKILCYGDPTTGSLREIATPGLNTIKLLADMRQE
ncbi:MAG: hypothetical protein KGI50_03495 [Patescibacteria group bacterium]|nr:hypothetical protein [Patescibacteria group bacterium]MDE2438356.1 hypothetical protein [Patescibacteria group bacterium]